LSEVLDLYAIVFQKKILNEARSLGYFSA
jgi:hypothetical protein